MRTHNLNATLQDIRQIMGPEWSFEKLSSLAGSLKGNSQPLPSKQEGSVTGWKRGPNKFYVCVSTSESVLHYTVNDSQGKFCLPGRRH